jgi:hypothetical protein
VRGRRTATVVSLLGALTVGHLIASRAETGLGDQPFVTSAAEGHVAHLTYGDVEVTDVTPARYVVPQVSTELARIAGGVFLLVSVKATATREPTTFYGAYLVDQSGRQYYASAKAECALLLKSGTGVPAYAVYCFDVPPDRLAGLRLQMGRGSLTYGTFQGDELADIDLGITASDAQSWSTTEDAYLAESSSRAPIELESVTLTETGS